MLDTLGYKHTLTICKTDCFSTATIVARTRINFTLYVRTYVARLVTGYKLTEESQDLQISEGVSVDTGAVHCNCQIFSLKLQRTFLFKVWRTRCVYKKAYLLKLADCVIHQQFNIQQVYLLPTLYLCVLYLSENKQRFVPLTA